MLPESSLVGVISGLPPLLIVMACLMMLATVACVIFFVLRRGAMPFCGGGGRERDEDPIEVLELRYARGELSRSEFERMKEELE